MYQDEAGINASRAEVLRLVAEEVEGGIPLSRIVIAGFSQGGAIVTWTGLQHSGTLAGVVCMSGSLPFKEKFAPTACSVKTPVLVLHGTEDEAIPVKRAAETRDVLVQKDFEVEYHEYEGMGHSASPQELDDLERWLAKVLAP